MNYVRHPSEGRTLKVGCVTVWEDASGLIAETPRLTRYGLDRDVEADTALANALTGIRYEDAVLVVARRDATV